MQCLLLIIDRLREHPALDSYHTILAPKLGEQIPEMIVDLSSEKQFLLACDDGFVINFFAGNFANVSIKCSWLFEETDRVSFSFTIDDDDFYRFVEEILIILQADKQLDDLLFIHNWRRTELVDKFNRAVQSPTTA